MKPSPANHFVPSNFPSNFLKTVLLTLLLSSLLALCPTTPVHARNRYVPDHGAPILSGNITGESWLAAAPESRLAFCHEASAAFRGSAAQSYTISWNVQSLTPAGLCDRLNQYYAQAENLDTRISAAAAIAPLLYADTPLKP